MRFFRPIICACAVLALTSSASAVTATRSNHSIYLSSQKTNLSAYTIERTDYVRVRDFAQAAGCSVSYDAQTASISINEGRPYDASAETHPPVTAPSVSAKPTSQRIYINDKPANIQSYSISGYNYFSIRDLGRALNWSTIYNGPQKRIELDHTYPYFEKNHNTVIFMYHAFTEDPKVLAKNPKLYTSPWKLRNNIRDMRALGYTCISLEDYFKGKAEKGKKYFIITIDDGYLDNFQLAYPIFVEEKAPASIFSVVRALERDTPNFFTAEQAKKMEDSGYIKVYAHNIDHISCTSISSEELTKEVQRAYEILDTKLAPKPLFFAYPYGAHNESTYVNVRDNGFHLQLVQRREFAADDVLVRKNVSYNSVMSELVKKAYHN